MLANNRLLALMAKLLLDGAIFAICSWGAFALRLGLPMPSRYAQLIPPYMAISVSAKLILWLIMGIWRRSWRTSSTEDLLSLVKLCFAVTVIASAVTFLVGYPNMPVPRGIPIIDGMITLLAMGAVRMTIRLTWESHGNRRGIKGAIIVGAGSAGVSIAKEMQRNAEVKLKPVAFADDDPNKLGLSFAGVQVAGTIDDLPMISHKFQAQEVIIAMPSASGKVIRRAFEAAERANLSARIIPPLNELISGKLSLEYVRDVRVEDLLRRDPVKLDLEEIGRYLTDKTVLITGAGGSIGSEIARQVMAFKPSLMVLLGRGENSLYNLEREMVKLKDCSPLNFVVADVRQEARLRSLFEKIRPQVVFHAAAHKHVPMMEQDPEEAVLNNIIGTRNVAQACLDFGVRTMVNISTDKAVNPSSVMGASKRIAEMVVRSLSLGAPSGSAFVSVRFGNVLGSRGSVIPLFKEQIRRGGPVTITDPRMTRYFMTIPEAAQLVLQAGGMRINGAVFVLDMGEPVRIVDMARDLIRLCGLEPDRDIKIQFTGQRPGEKLFEELLTPQEDTQATRHDKIFVAKGDPIPQDLMQVAEELMGMAEKGDKGAIREIMERIIPGCDLSAPYGNGKGLTS